MDVGLLDHCNILTRKLDETVRFYERALGMRSGPRPPLTAGSVAVSRRSSRRPCHRHCWNCDGARRGAGAVDHIAFPS
ncbi:VOC family protein [Tardibacter chloracetimidivorans]|uniref:VOC family protein n=1 Tax=Tardibacter chloracetimidivorans TaxID=1921510 RepID=UPI003AAECB14